MSYAANLQSIFRTLSGALLVPNQQVDQQTQQPHDTGFHHAGHSHQHPHHHHHSSATDLRYTQSNPTLVHDSSSSQSTSGMDVSTQQYGDNMDIDDQHHEGEWDEEEDSSDDMDEDDEEDEDEDESAGGGDALQANNEQCADDKEKEIQVQQHQADLRKRIMLIQQDSSIPAADKARKIQELMTQGYTQKQQTRATTSTRVTNRLENRRRDFNELTEADRQPTYHDKPNGVLGCKHYQRAAKLQAHCCGKWDTCRFCHDEVSDHNIVRNLITTMMCMYCSTVQPAGQDCINESCRRRVAKYYCKECKLWDSDPRKNIYHCYDCGICRIGKGLGIDYFHCKKCNVCMAISLKGRHKCIERNLESDCPICGEYMFTSTTTVIFMPCGHCIHYKCHQEYIQTSYQCPTCLKSLADMSDYFRRIDIALAQQQMPQEYANLFNHVYCNDCEKKCYAKFHFMYHKCVTCRGYNTKVLHTADKSQVPADQLKLIYANMPQVAAGSTTPQASSPTSPNTAVNPEPPQLVQEDSAASLASGRRGSTVGRSTSSLGTVASNSRRASMVQRGVTYYCHQCQASTNPVMVAGTQRCMTCDSDFLEQL